MTGRQPDQDHDVQVEQTHVRDVRLLTVPEVADLLRLTKKGVYSLVERRLIPFVKVSNRLRFRLRDVLSFIEENRVSARDQE